MTNGKNCIYSESEAEKYDNLALHQDRGFCFEPSKMIVINFNIDCINCLNHKQFGYLPIEKNT
jgi:hypothetical protein